MDTLKNSLVPALVALAVSFGAYAVFAPDDGKPGRNGNDGSDGQSLGALTGPMIPSDYLQWGAGNGIPEYRHGLPMTTATTTVCNIQSPAATSTLISAVAYFSVGSTTATTLTWSKADTPSATSSTGAIMIATTTAAANATPTFIAATTTTGPLQQLIGATDRVFGPSKYLNLSMTGGIGTFSPTGVCNATFQELKVI